MADDYKDFVYLTEIIFHELMKSRGGELWFKSGVFCCQVDEDSSDSGDNLTGFKLVPCTPVSDYLASGHIYQGLS